MHAKHCASLRRTHPALRILYTVQLPRARGSFSEVGRRLYELGSSATQLELFPRRPDLWPGYALRKCLEAFQIRPSDGHIVPRPCCTLTTPLCISQ